MMGEFGEASLAKFGAASTCSRGARRNFQRRRQRHLLKIRAGLLAYGVPSLVYGFADCDYGSFLFTLTADALKEARVSTGTGDPIDVSNDGEIADHFSDSLATATAMGKGAVTMVAASPTATTATAAA